MPTNYISNPSGSRYPPSAVPGGGAPPILSLPVDGDPATAASVAQAFKATADSIALVQASSRPDIAVVGAGSSGFTAPTYSAFGGTVAPSGAHQSDAQRIVIQIQAGGAVGVATFKTSINGGATFGATQTTAASMTDATSGITLAFAGTLTAFGTATFRSAFTPLAQWRDASGNGRVLVDHNGYFGGKRFDFREDWIASFGTISTTQAPITALQRWRVDIVSGAQLTVTNPPAGLSTPMMQLLTGATNGSSVSLATASAVVYIATFSSLVWESDVYISATLGTWSLTCGLSNSFDSWIIFSLGSAAANVLCKVSSVGSAAPDVNTGVTVASLVGTLARLRIEVHGSASPYGSPARAFFFVNDLLVGVTSTNIPTNALSIAYQLLAGAVSSGSTVLLSGTTLVHNRYLSAPSL